MSGRALREARRRAAALLRALGAAMGSGLVPTAPARFDVRGWTGELSALTCALAEGRIRPRRWQEGMDRLYARVDIPTLLAQIDFDALRDRLRLEDGTGERFVKASLPGKRGVVTKVAAVRRGAAIPPHAHANMVSAFLVLSGAFRVRLYEREGELPGGCVLRPAVDRCLGPGAWTSTSDERHNVHWLTATAEDTFLFSAKRVGLETGHAGYGRRYLDPTVPAGAGTRIAAPWIPRDRAYAVFGGGAPPARKGEATGPTEGSRRARS